LDVLAIDLELLGELLKNAPWYDTNEVSADMVKIDCFPTPILAQTVRKRTLFQSKSVFFLQFWRPLACAYSDEAQGYKE
jgi:hypothetical protein